MFLRGSKTSAFLSCPCGAFTYFSKGNLESLEETDAFGNTFQFSLSMFIVTFASSVPKRES